MPLALHRHVDAQPFVSTGNALPEVSASRRLPLVGTFDRSESNRAELAG